MTSVAPPAANGTMSVIIPFGSSVCAHALLRQTNPATAPAVDAQNPLRVMLVFMEDPDARVEGRAFDTAKEHRSQNKPAATTLRSPRQGPSSTWRFLM